MVKKITQVITSYSEKGRRFTVHDRPTAGISFCYEGKITYELNGRQYVSDREHAIIHPKGQTYRLYGNEQGRFPVINFEAQPECEPQTFTVIPIKNTESYLRDYEKLRTLHFFGSSHSAEMSLLYGIISRLNEEMRQKTDPLISAVTLIEEDFSSRDLSNEQLAETVGLSEVYFRRLFLKRYGITPRQYIIELRIKKAKLLLESSSKSITEIAEECGFSGVYHFCRSFKQNTGDTPTEYRRREYGI